MGLLALFGAVFIIIGSIMLFRTIATQHGGVRTYGTVIDNRESTYTDMQHASHTVYAPVIRFATQGGHTVEFVARVRTSTVYAVGEHVPIVYQPGKPEQAILDTALGTWFIPTVFIVFGLVFFLIGLIGFLFDGFSAR